jgi:hypothetical protein
MKNVVNTTSFATWFALNFCVSMACSWTLLSTCNKFIWPSFALVCGLYEAPCAAVWYISELFALVSTRGLLPFFPDMSVLLGLNSTALFQLVLYFAPYVCLILYGCLGQCSYDRCIVSSYCSGVPFLHKPALNGFCCIFCRCCNFVGLTWFVYLLAG